MKRYGWRFNTDGEQQAAMKARTLQHLELRVPIVPPLLLLPAPSGEKIPSGDRKKHGDIDGRKDQGMTQKRGYIVSPPHSQTDRDID